MDNVTDKTGFDNKLKQDKIVIATFIVDWCPDCHFIDPFIDNIIKKFESDIYAFSVNVDQVPEVKQEHNVSGIPSFIAFKDGKEIHRFVSRQRKTEQEITTFFSESLNK
ncbi:MAG: thioredoxin family protein [Spirochaetaceae bacterium]